jgi:hypothetical protein
MKHFGASHRFERKLDPELKPEEAAPWGTGCGWAETDAKMQAALREHHPEREGLVTKPGTEAPRTLPRADRDMRSTGFNEIGVGGPGKRRG